MTATKSQAPDRAQSLKDQPALAAGGAPAPKIEPKCEPQRANPIPAELCAIPQFVGWKSVPADPKPRKLPIDPKTGKAASSTDPHTWSDYNTAVAAVKHYGLTGVGFVFTDGDPYCGVDLDNCRNPETGEIAEWAQGIIAALDSYTEMSPSKTGVKIFLRAKLPTNTKHNVEFQTGSVEVYDSGRYFTATGQHVSGTSKTIENRQAELTTVYANVFGKAESTPAPQSAPDVKEKIVSPHRIPYLRSRLGTMLKGGMDPTAIEAALLAENLAKCSPPEDETKIRKMVADMCGRYPNAPSSPTESSQSKEQDWPEPEELGEELPPVPTFDAGLLPLSLRSMVEDVADRMQVPLDYPAVVSVATLAGVCGRRTIMQPKERDSSWLVVPNLWGGIVGDPGMMKSPVIATITAPARALEADWRADHAEAMREYEAAQERAILEKAVWAESYKRASKKQEPLPTKPKLEVIEPSERRLIAVDATFESLHQLLAENSAGLFVSRDELTGWLASLERQGRESERAFYLECWSGDTGFTIDRIGRGSIHVEHCCVSLFGGIQPARLRAYLADALRDGPSNDGLIQRFQLLVWPDFKKGWSYRDRTPNAGAMKAAESVYRRIAEMDAEKPHRLKFAPDAQALFVEWLTDLEMRLRTDEISPFMQAHLAKYRKLMPALALLFSIADNSLEAVGLHHAQQAADWCEYLAYHARRVYASRISPERLAAISLGQRLIKGWKRESGRFTVRDVYQNDWAGLVTPDEARAAVRVLEDAGWVRPEKPESDTGRPSEVYAVSPRIGGAHVGN